MVPAVDVLAGQAVRLLRGDYARIEVSAGDPFETIRRAALRQPPFIHVVALDAARDGGPPVELVRAATAAAASVPIQVGGGVRSVADALSVVDSGASRVVIGTAAYGPEPLRDYVDALETKLAVAVDVLDGVVRTGGWLRSSEVPVADALDRCSGAGVATVVCTSIDRDGTQAGPDLGLLATARARFDGELFAAGGIRDEHDLEAVRDLGLDGAVVGRAWLDGSV